ncbi:MAG: APC family permease [Legionella sp.]|uniref:APC family permease n=1 Tax=Legionella sp. TaxID=459 RepID=UPI00284C4D96|nr:APC family permease [Legionella sp.]
MSLINKIFGRPLASSAAKKQELTIMTGVPALGLDALSSTAYGPEATLTILLSLGAVGLHYSFLISGLVVVVLISLYFSYLQTAAVYPKGGGAYIVASDNLGRKYGLWAAISLILDYLLNVAVGISAGVGAVVSAIPELQQHTLALCLIILLMLTLVNLRGIRESGVIFIIPTLIFIVCIASTLIIGVVKVWASGGHPLPIVSTPKLPAPQETLSIWLFLAAFANGLTAMTGVEAVSNSVPLFKKPKVRNAQLTLSIIVITLALFLLLIGYLCPAYSILAMDELHPGYQTILSQLVAAITGKGVFYYISIVSIFIVLAYSAQTSFADFPRVCRLLAEDNYLPHFFAERGRRLVYSVGIILLAVCSAALLVIFKGITNKLIPLFAVGAFSAFLFSQIGMIVHWVKNDGPHMHLKLMVNSIGAVITAIALIIIIATKFMEGAWIIVFLAPALAYLMGRIRHHYLVVANEVETPIKLFSSKLEPPVVIIPIQGLDCIAQKAMQFGMSLSDDVTALFIDTGSSDVTHLKKVWTENIEASAKKLKVTVPQLEIIKSPYRRIYKPVLNYIKKVKKQRTDRIIALIIPELVEPKWYEYLLHNIHAPGLRALLFLERDERTVVITIPWYLRESALKRSHVDDDG